MKKNRFIKNTGWLVGGKVFQMLISLVITSITARYLGPNNYGLMNYTNAYISFFSSLCTLGLNGIIVKELVSNRENEGEILGTALIMRLVCSMISMISIYFLLLNINNSNKELVMVGMLQSISILFSSFDVINFWYQSNLQSKYTTIIQSIAYVVMSIYRVIILILGKNVSWFAFAVSLDTIVVALILIYSYKINKNQGQNLRFSKQWVKRLLKQSYPLIISGIMVTIYGQMDKIMIGQILDNKQVGLYSTAIAITGLWSFIPIAFIDSAHPIIMEQKNINQTMYIKRLKQLYAFIIWLSFIYAFFMMIFSKYIILILYGKDYLDAQGALSITVWYCAFSYLGAAKNIWIVCENKMKYELFFTLVGATSNIVLNLVLIPTFGINGAAIATLCTQIITNFLIMFVFKETRDNAKLVLSSFFLKDVIDAKEIVNLIKRKVN